MPDLNDGTLCLSRPADVAGQQRVHSLRRQDARLRLGLVAQVRRPVPRAPRRGRREKSTHLPAVISETSGVSLEVPDKHC